MSVELITHNAGEVLDLTGGKDDRTEVETTEVEDIQPESGEQLGGGEEGTQSTEEGSSDDTGATDDIGDDTESELEYFFGDTQVNVQVPDEIESALKEIGIESKDLLSQLFKKDGDFSLDEATKAKLDEKYGKLLVDGYLNMYRGLNEQSVSKSKSELESLKAKEAENHKAYTAAVGGEEGLVKMEDYIVKSFTPDQISAYNAVMENGDHQSQMLIISQVRKMQELEDKAINGDRKVELVGDKETSLSSNASPIEKGFLTGAEFSSIMNGDEYWTDKAFAAKVDAARKAGIRRQV